MSYRRSIEDFPVEAEAAIDEDRHEARVGTIYTILDDSESVAPVIRLALQEASVEGSQAPQAECLMDTLHRHAREGLHVVQMPVSQIDAEDIKVLLRMMHQRIVPMDVVKLPKPENLVQRDRPIAEVFQPKHILHTQVDAQVFQTVEHFRYLVDEELVQPVLVVADQEALVDTLRSQRFVDLLKEVFRYLHLGDKSAGFGVLCVPMTDALHFEEVPNVDVAVRLVPLRELKEGIHSRYVVLRYMGVRLD